MQLARYFCVVSFSDRDARLLAFSGETPAESPNLRKSKPDSQQPPTPADSEVRQAKIKERRDDRNRRETWERHCEQMTNKELLHTLGELHVKNEDGDKQINDFYVRQSPNRLKQAELQSQLIHEQLAGARQVFLDRKGKPLVNDLAKEIAADDAAAVQTDLAKARERLSQFSPTSSRYAEERLKTASLEEQAYLNETARAMAVRRQEIGRNPKQ